MPLNVPTRCLDEAALLAGCSPRTLRRYVALGLVGAERVGGRRGALRFTDQDIEDAIGVRVSRVEKVAACAGQTTLITFDGDLNPDAVAQCQDLNPDAVAQCQDVSRPAA